jgi:hypothetical protein
MAIIKPVYTNIPQIGAVEYTLGGKVPVDADTVTDVGARFTNKKSNTTITVKSLYTLEEGDTIRMKSSSGTSYVLTASADGTTSEDTTAPKYEIGATKATTASNMKDAIAALTNFTATVSDTVVYVTQSTAGEAGNTRVYNSNKACISTASFKGGGYAYDEHDEATEALTKGYAKTTADAKMLEHARKRNLGLI